jgi:hypothetical protein
LVNDELFWRSANDTLLHCILLEEGYSILEDIHSGICGSQAGARTLVDKTYRYGFYWPTTIYDADSLVHRCEDCQYFDHQKHVLSNQLQTIPITWPFSTWGLDLVGPLKSQRWIYTHLRSGGQDHHMGRSKTASIYNNNQGSGINQRDHVPIRHPQ